ncbi:homoserine kinase [Reinekea forsetii]|nr:homoserine kinase [Reinekea forsetii]
MSVYTELNKHEVSSLLSHYDLGGYVSHQGISAGVENTNYFVSTDQHELVLTIFEKHSFEELPFFVELGEHLHKHHCSVPQPYRQADGQFIFTIKGKPGVFFERVSGGHVEHTQPYIEAIATALAKVHLATAEFNAQREHSHGLAWVKRTLAQIQPTLAENEQIIASKAIELISQLPTSLPQGVIHADLFHDNALFDQQKLSGIIDWYFAGIDSYALDIAITLNDWCLNDDDAVFADNQVRFIAAYQSVRPLSKDELQAVPILQVQSGLRFWLSRLLAQREHGASSEAITVKDPELMKQLLVRLMSSLGTIL